MDKTVVTPKFLEPLSAAWLEWRIGGAKQGAADTAIDSRPFINCVRDIKRHKAWEVYFKDGAKTWERFCQEVLRTEPEFADQVELGVRALEEAGHFGDIPVSQALEAAAKVQAKAENAPLINRNGEVGRGRENSRASGTAIKRGSNSTEYLAARIRRDHPDIHERMKAGEYTSVRRAAIDAGIVRELTPLEKAQKAWMKMTEEERVIFRDWIEA